MEKMFNEMMKSYIDKYMQTSDFQKSMLLSMINVFNQNNLAYATNNLFSSTNEDIKHMSNEIANILNESHSSISIEKCKILCSAVLNISKLIDTIKSTPFMFVTFENEINNIYDELSALNIKKRTLSLKEWLELDEDVNENNNAFEQQIYEPIERAQESKLKKYGYSVAWDSPLSTNKRQELLKHLIESGKITKGYVISYLKHNIKINGRKETNEFAVLKWKEDLDFVYKL